MKFKSTIKSLVLIPAAFLLMGNQKSCQQEPVAMKRQLKRIVEIGMIKSPAINFGSAGSFDFEFVANQQIISVLQSSGDFAFRLMPPVQTGSSALNVFDGSSTGGSRMDSKFLSLGGSDKILMKQWLEAPSQKPAVLATQSKEAWCMVNNPQAVISGSVNSFEMLGGGGLKIGFSPLGTHAVSFSALDVQIEFLQLDLSLHATSPLVHNVVASSNVTSKQTKTRVGFGLNIGLLTLGPSYYHQTPLARVTKSALTKAVNDLRAQFKSTDWYTRVLANKDEEMMIVGGENVNLKVGDELAFYNEIYTWSGEPCNSTLQYDGIAKMPVALGVVTTVGKDLSFVKITHEEEERVEIGSTVKLVKMIEDIQAEAAAPQPKK